MASASLTTYLNDHLAGSVAAMELVELLTDLYRGDEGERTLEDLRDQIEEDRRVLIQVLHAVGGSESPAKRAAAWLTEKATQVKLKLGDPTGKLRLLEALEALGLGIEGKLALWRALEAAANRSPALRAFDYDTLVRRAEDQFGRVDRLRLELAPIALTV